MVSFGSADVVSVRRSLLLLAAGAAVGLGLAGYSLFTARGTSTLRVPPEDVALVNQQPISRVDYTAQLQTLYGVDGPHSTRQQRTKVLDDLIREELFVQRGRELDVASFDPDVRNAMVNAVELEIAAEALSSVPSDEQLRRFYSGHADRYSTEGTMTVQDYVFAPDKAAAAAAFARAPPTAATATTFGATPSSTVGDEQFYFAARIHLGAALFEVARSMNTNSVSKVIAEAGALHVLYMVANTKPVPLAFADARDRVLNDYRNDSVVQLQRRNESFLRKRANVLVTSELR